MSTDKFAQDKNWQIYKHSPDAVIVIDSMSRIIYANPQTEELFGLCLISIKGNKYQNIFTDNNQTGISKEIINWVSKNKKTKDRIYYRTNAEGIKSWYWQICYPVFKNDGNLDIVVVITRDITKIKQTKEIVQAGKLKFSLAIEASGAGYYEHLADFKQFKAGRRWAQMMGYDLKDLPDEDKLWRWWMDQIHPEDLPKFKKSYHDFIIGNTNRLKSQFRIKYQSGKWHTMQVAATAVQRDESQQAASIAGITIDITRQRRVEREMKLLAKFSVENPNPVMRIKSDGLVQFANQASWPILEAWNVSQGEYLSKELRAFIQNIYLTGETKEIELEHNGKIFAINIITFNDIDCLYLYGRNISQQKQSQLALIENEKKFRTYFEYGLIGIAISSAKEVWLDVNHRFCEIFGYSRQQLNKVNWDKLVYPNDLANHLALFNKMNEGELDNCTVEERFIRNNGDIIYVVLYIRCIRNNDGSVNYFITHLQDITEQKKAQDALQRSEEALNRAQQVAHIGSWRLDLTNNVLMWSQETYRMFGIPLGTKLTYEQFLKMVYSDDRDYVHNSWMAALNKKLYDVEHRILVNGKIKWVREKAVLEFNKKGEPVCGIGTVQDITLQKQTENELNNYKEHLEDLVHERTDALKKSWEIIRSSEQKFRSVFEESPIGICLFNLDNKVISTNKALCKMLGFQKQSVIILIWRISYIRRMWGNIWLPAMI